MSDYTRFASHPRAQIWSQAIVVPVMGTLTCLIGIICTSVAAQFYPEEGLLWSPYALFTAIQMHGGNGARAAVFFACEYLCLPSVSRCYADPRGWSAALSFLISQFGINIGTFCLNDHHDPYPYGHGY
jgi:cytosine/uracil/thiamine/allantoin permease